MNRVSKSAFNTILARLCIHHTSEIGTYSREAAETFLIFFELVTKELKNTHLKQA